MNSGYSFATKVIIERLNDDDVLYKEEYSLLSAYKSSLGVVLIPEITVNEYRNMTTSQVVNRANQVIGYIRSQIIKKDINIEYEGLAVQYDTLLCPLVGTKKESKVLGSYNEEELDEVESSLEPQYRPDSDDFLTIWYNPEVSKIFQRNDCVCPNDPGVGTFVTYKVLKGTYSSTISQLDAYKKALDDINANGQNYANANGSCLPCPTTTTTTTTLAPQIAVTIENRASEGQDIFARPEGQDTWGLIYNGQDWTSIIYQASWVEVRIISATTTTLPPRLKQSILALNSQSQSVADVMVTPNGLSSQILSPGQSYEWADITSVAAIGSISVTSSVPISEIYVWPGYGSATISGLNTSSVTLTNLAVSSNNWLYFVVRTASPTTTSTTTTTTRTTTSTTTSTTTTTTTRTTTTTTTSTTTSTVAPPTISISASETTLAVGATVVFFSTYSPLGGSHQWYRDGTAISGATSDTYILSESSAGSYNFYCIYTVSSRVAQSNVLTVTWFDSDISISANSTTFYIGDTIYLSSTVSLTGGSYQWYRDGTAISGATSSTYSESQSTPGSYTYTCAYTVNGQTTTSNAVTAAWRPTISISASSTSVTIGTTVTLSSTVSPTGGSYQWYRDGTAISGATSSTYSESQSTPGSYTYTCAYTVNGQTTTSSAVTVAWRPTISISASSTSVTIGTTVTLSSTVSPTGGSYQWYRDGTAISGATSSTYSESQSTPGSYTYTCYYAVNNQVGTSSAVTVAWRPTISISASSTSVTIGTTVTLSSTVSPTGGSYQWYRDGTAISGATSSTYSESQSTPGSYTYTCAYTVNGQTTTSSAVTVAWRPTISISASSTSVTIGTTVTLSSTVSPTGGSYQWYRDGTAISGATSSTYSESQSTPGSYTYTCAYTVNGQTTTSSAVTVAWRPTISISASSTSVTIGTTVTLSSTVSPTGGSYQWYRDGTAISGATSSTYSESQSTPGSYTYTCAYTVNGQTTTSSAVTVAWRPTISISASSTSVTIGTTVTLSSTVSPTGGSYQWYRDGTAISGATSSTYSESQSTPGSYTYTCAYTVNGQTTTSSAVTVAWRPTISISASSTSVTIGTTVTLSSTVSPTGGSYQWYRDGTAISGATSSTYSESQSTPGSYTYTCAYTVNGQTTTSSAVTVAWRPTISISASSTSVTIGTTVTLSSTVSPTGGSYQWYRDGTAISGATSSTYSESQSTPGSYTYTCAYTVNGQTTTSSAVTVAWRPTISISASSTSVTIGTTVTLSSTVSPTGGSYQWYRDGTAISGATSSTYSESQSTPGSYTYTCAYTVNGQTTTSSAVTVAWRPTISISASSTSVTIGTTVTLSSTVSPTGGSYQWYRDGTAISGATSSTYSESQSTPGSYTYTCAYTVNGQTTTSSAVTVTWNPTTTTTTSTTTTSTTTTSTTTTTRTTTSTTTTSAPGNLIVSNQSASTGEVWVYADSTSLGRVAAGSSGSWNVSIAALTYITLVASTGSYYMWGASVTTGSATLISTTPKQMTFGNLAASSAGNLGFSALVGSTPP